MVMVVDWKGGDMAKIESTILVVKGGASVTMGFSDQTE